jgi:hypothetical protein
MLVELCVCGGPDRNRVSATPALLLRYRSTAALDSATGQLPVFVPLIRGDIARFPSRRYCMFSEIQNNDSGGILHDGETAG